jgi:hypothetical protein
MHNYFLHLIRCHCQSQIPLPVWVFGFFFSAINLWRETAFAAAFAAAAIAPLFSFPICAEDVVRVAKAVTLH